MPIALDRTELTGDLEYYLANVQRTSIHDMEAIIESLKHRIDPSRKEEERSGRGRIPFRIKYFSRTAFIVLFVLIAIVALWYFAFQPKLLRNAAGSVHHNRTAIQYYERAMTATGDVVSAEMKIRLLERAIALDSSFAAAYTALAIVYLHTPISDTVSFERAKIATSHALIADPTYTPALAALTSIYLQEGQLDAALKVANDYFMYRNGDLNQDRLNP